jgi:DNA-binding transcriptional LysR family regulator
MVNVKDFEFFQSLVATGSFTQTARDCKVSQPTVSAALQKLEKQLGTTLFDRNRFQNQVTLTHTGELFRPRVTKILAELNRAIDEIDNDEARRVIRFGLPPIIGRYYFSSVIPKLVDAHLFSSVKIMESGSELLLRELASNNIDMGLIGSLDEDFTSPQVAIERLASFPFRIFVSRKHRLAERATVSMIDVARERFVSLTDTFLHHRVLADLFESAGLDLNLAAETNQIDTFKSLVTANVGIGLMTNLTMRRDADELRELEFETSTPLPRFNIYLFHAKSKFLSPAEERVISILRSENLEFAQASL